MLFASRKGARCTIAILLTMMAWSAARRILPNILICTVSPCHPQHETHSLHTPEVMEQRSPPSGDLNRRRKERKEWKRGKTCEVPNGRCYVRRGGVRGHESFPAGSKKKKGIFPHIQGEEVHLKRERTAMRKKMGAKKRRIMGKRNKKIGFLLFVAIAWMRGLKILGRNFFVNL